MLPGRLRNTCSREPRTSSSTSSYGDPGPTSARRVSSGRPGSGHVSTLLLLVDTENPQRVAPQELGPDVVPERDVLHLGHDPLQGETHREVAGVDHLVGAP